MVMEVCVNFGFGPCHQLIDRLKSLAYDDLALNRSTYNDYDQDYTSYNAGNLTPGPRPRRTSSVSFSQGYTTQPRYHDNYNRGYRPRTTIVKFRQKGALTSGLNLTTAAAPGTKLSGGDYLKWHEINADVRGRIYLRVKVSLTVFRPTFTSSNFVGIHSSLSVDRLPRPYIRNPRRRL